MDVVLGVSNRHVHLCERDFKILFGDEAKLEVVKELVQPGEFASNCFVTIKTEKSEIQKVRVLGPLRSYTQVEVSKTDAFKLGINPPVRDSGDLAGSERVTLIGPNGSIDLKEGCIIATRHIHITPDQMVQFGFEGMKSVNVELPGEKGGILYNVQFKVSPNYAFEMHIDTDDANAHMVKTGDIARIIK